MRVVKPVILFGFAIAGVAFSACTSSYPVGNIDEAPETAPPPSFVREDAGDSAAEPEAVEMCVATTCPQPYATCEGDVYPCTTNLSRDVNNCGSCGNVCLQDPQNHLQSICVEGRCEPRCPPANTDVELYRNCNGKLEDGCEANIYYDTSNCGGCGVVCPPGVRCHDGSCNCPPGLTDCGDCVDTRIDSWNCGACGHACSDPADACEPLPPNTFYGCADSQCNQLRCYYGASDCNRDLSNGCASDGCEVDVLSDPHHCGGCDSECMPGEFCDSGTCKPIDALDAPLHFARLITALAR